MADEKSNGRSQPQRTKQQQYLPMSSFHGACNLLFYLGMVAAFMLCCAWFIMRPYEKSDLVLPSTIDSYVRISRSIANKVEIDPALQDAVEKDHTPAPFVHNASNHLQHELEDAPKVEIDPALQNAVEKDHSSVPFVHNASNHIQHELVDARAEDKMFPEDVSPKAHNKSIDTVVHSTYEIQPEGHSSPAHSDHTMQTIDSSMNSTLETNQNNIASTSSVFECEFWRGEWIPDPDPPLYTNKSCKFMDHQRDCVANGRPDKEYLYWRWKPSDCDLPRFDASAFLEMMRGKKLAFIGDSLARNQGSSLVCLLAQADDDAEKDKWQLKWFFPLYNFTLTIFWSPFLVQNSIDKDGVSTLHLDVPDPVWSDSLHEYDIAIFSTGYWHFRVSMYYINNTLFAVSHNADTPNVTKLEFLGGYRLIMEYMLQYIAREYQGVAVVRTVTVDHFENGEWNQGGTCNRTRPYAARDATLSWRNAEMNKMQIEAFDKARASVTNGSPLKLLLLNVTYSASMRPDGHPGSHRSDNSEGSPNDCVHWCVPGPVDTWNQMLQHSLTPIFTGASITL